MLHLVVQSCTSTRYRHLFQGVDRIPLPVPVQAPLFHPFHLAVLVRPSHLAVLVHLFLIHQVCQLAPAHLVSPVCRENQTGLSHPVDPVDLDYLPVPVCRGPLPHQGNPAVPVDLVALTLPVYHLETALVARVFADHLLLYAAGHLGH